MFYSMLIQQRELCETGKMRIEEAEYVALSSFEIANLILPHSSRNAHPSELYEAEGLRCLLEGEAQM
jgi:hypothetical protein